MSLQTELETSASVPYIKLFYILYSEGFYKNDSYIICLIYSTFYS